MKARKPFWSGVFPAITTQLNKDQSLDLEATARHADALIHSGVQGIIFPGSLGENQPLRADEKRRLLEAMVEAVHGWVKVLSGVAESSTAEASRYAREAQLTLTGEERRRVLKIIHAGLERRPKTPRCGA